MKMKKIISAFAAGIMILSSTFSVCAASAQEQIEDAQAQVQAAEAELEQTLGNINNLENKKQELEAYLADLNAEYDELTRSVSELGIQAAEKEEELKAIKKELKKAKKAAEVQYENMKLRIVYMYENGGSTMLELLLSSESLTEFLNRAENISQISRYDREMLRKYEELQKKIKEQEKQAKEESEEIDTLLAERSSKQQEVQNLAAGTSDNIQTYINLISSSEAEAAALNAQIANKENQISALYVQAEAEQAEAQRQAEQEASEEVVIRDVDDDYDPYEDTTESSSSATSEDIQVEYVGTSEGDGESYGDSSDYEAEEVQETSSQGTYLGNFTLTAYCNCASCCGTAGNLTASGTVPTAGRTVAMAGVPFGTQLLINGNVYTVEDLGTPYGHVDIYFNSHSDALAFGLQSAEVYQVG